MTILKINLFFDGTGNNGFNATALTARQGGSYQASPTNIFKLFKSCEIACRSLENSIAVYVEGIGTINYHDDSVLDFAMGSVFLHYGGRSKIRNALEYINNAFIKLTQNHPVEDKITFEFDIFGFSRGAVLARFFAIQLKDRKSEVYKMLEKIAANKEKSTQLESVKVNFMGLFDSVESFKRNPMDIRDLNLATNVYQLTALHECRKNFKLTSILPKASGYNLNETGSGTGFVEVGNTTNYEFCVPGCHADLGGGYLHPMNVKSMLTVPGLKDRTSKDKEFFYENEKWSYLFNDSVVKVGTKNFQNYLSYERDGISAELHLVYLMLMANTAKRFGCKLDMEYLSRNYEKNLPAPLKNFLIKINQMNENVLNKKRFSEYFDSDDLQAVAPFIHISAHYDSFFSGKVKPNPDDPVQPGPIKSILFQINESRTKGISNLINLRIDRVNEPDDSWTRKVIRF